ncbi:MAG: 3D domain-containing protein [Chloroflexota bacterium]
MITLKGQPARRRLIVIAVAALTLAAAALVWYLWPVPVTVAFDGQTQAAKLHRGTVRTALADLGLVAGPLDEVTPALETRLTSGMEIRLVRVTEQVVEEDVVIPHPVTTRESSTLSQGIIEVTQKGVDGKEHRTVKEVYRDGELARRDVLTSTVIREPVAEIAVHGTGRSVTVSRGGVTYRSRRILTVVATAYDPSVGSTTYTGTPVELGIIAVDPRVIPLGTRLYVDGYGYGVAADIGGAIKGNRIDVAFPTRAEALRWGRRTVTVFILEKAP